MYGFGVWPKTALQGISEKITRLDVNPLALPTGGEGENKGKELGERKFAVAGEILWQPLVMVVNTFGDEL